jgi:uncharacterized protein (TIGR03437 family)
MQLQAQQILAVAPFELTGKSTTVVTVVNGSRQSNAVTVGVLSKSLDILTLLNQDFTVNSAANPAALGSTVTLYATGLGQTSPAGVDGQVNSAPLPVPVSPVQGVILYDPAAEGNQWSLPITFQAAAYGLVAGITQINIALTAAYTGSNPAMLVLDHNGTTAPLYFK